MLSENLLAEGYLRRERRGADSAAAIWRFRWTVTAIAGLLTFSAPGWAQTSLRTPAAGYAQCAEEEQDCPAAGPSNGVANQDWPNQNLAYPTTSSTESQPGPLRQLNEDTGFSPPRNHDLRNNDLRNNDL